MYFQIGQLFNIMDFFYNLIDEITFRQLKESNYIHPEITDVIVDHNRMFEMVLDSVDLTEKGYDTVIDSVMYNFLLKYFKHGIDLIDKRIKETGVKKRTIVDAFQVFIIQCLSK